MKRVLVGACLMVALSTTVAGQEVALRYTTGWPNTPTPWIDDVQTLPLGAFLGTSGGIVSSGHWVTLTQDAVITKVASVMVPIVHSQNSCPFSQNFCMGENWYLEVWGPDATHPDARTAFEANQKNGNLVSLHPLTSNQWVNYADSQFDRPPANTVYAEFTLSAPHPVLEGGQTYLVGALWNPGPTSTIGGEMHISGSLWDTGVAPSIWFSSGSPVPSKDTRGIGAFDVYGIPLNPAIDGDYDHDGDVDGADFLVWQRGGSPTPLSSADLVIWQNNYGAGSPLAAAQATLPEPNGLILLLSALACRFRFRRPEQAVALIRHRGESALFQS